MNIIKILIITMIGLLSSFAYLAAQESHVPPRHVFKAGHSSLQYWLLPLPGYPLNNTQTVEKVELGKQLFFDPRLSKDGSIACSSCHDPNLGWSDGKAKSIGMNNVILTRSSPTIINTAYNVKQMWDGRAGSLEEQALLPMKSKEEMHVDFEVLIPLLKAIPQYHHAFIKVFGDEGVSVNNIAKALAAFERTLISDDSAFDRWLKGDASAMTEQQIEGFKLFVDDEKTACQVCHSAPNFTDDGFHNIGVSSIVEGNDLGRYKIIPLPSMKGAFKTPTLREVDNTAPYFHDGSAATLADAVEHYNSGFHFQENLSPNFLATDLNEVEISALASFLEALSSPLVFERPQLPEADVGELYFKRHCQLCHGEYADGNGKMATVMKPRPANLLISNLSEEAMHGIISQGGEAHGRSPSMPPWGQELTRAEIKSIIRYLIDIREIPGGS